MYIYKISRPDEADYNEYDAAIVVANTYFEARTLQPNGSINDGINGYNTWIEQGDVIVDLIGVADDDFKEKCVLLASFNAG